MKLSVLQNDAVQVISEFAQQLEGWGYNRLWFGEHHDEGQINQPVVAAAAALVATGKIKIGTAGVLLRAYSPFAVAEQFAMLYRQFTTRFEGGIVSSLPMSPMLEAITDGRSVNELGTFSDKTVALFKIFRDQSESRLSLHRGELSEFTSQMWICGMSIESAKLAGELGINFAYHGHFANVAKSKGKSIDPISHVLDIYRNEHIWANNTSYPKCAVAYYGSVDSDDLKARKLWNEYFCSDLPEEPDFCASYHQASNQLEELLEHSHADELIIRIPLRCSKRMLDVYEGISGSLSIKDF